MIRLLLAFLLISAIFSVEAHADEATAKHVLVGSLAGMAGTGFCVEASRLAHGKPHTWECAIGAWFFYSAALTAKEIAYDAGKHGAKSFRDAGEGSAGSLAGFVFVPLVEW